MIRTSEETSKLFKSLAQFQKNVSQPKKDASNPFFKSKYVPLENVVDVIHEAGAPLGLYEGTYPVQEDGLVGVGVIITHESGQFIEYPPILLKPSKNDPQGYGAAMTYARRYALSSAFGIASETDDDANSISGQVNNKVNKQPPVATVTKKQADDLTKQIKELSQYLEDKQGGRKTEMWLVGKYSQSGDSLLDVEKNNYTKATNDLQRMIDKNKPVADEVVSKTEQGSLLEGNTTTVKGAK